MEKFVPFNPTDKYTIAVVKNKQTGEDKAHHEGRPPGRAPRIQSASSSSVQASAVTVCLHTVVESISVSWQSCDLPP